MKLVGVRAFNDVGPAGDFRTFKLPLLEREEPLFAINSAAPPPRHLILDKNVLRVFVFLRCHWLLMKPRAGRVVLGKAMFGQVYETSGDG